MGVLGSIGKWAGKMDPTSLALGGLSLLGGGDEQQQRQSYRQPGSPTDPIQALYYAISAASRLGQGMQEKGPVRLRSSIAPPPPVPVSIPGLGFQIGGGLGRDPAIDNPDLAGYDLSSVFKYDPFQGFTQNEASRLDPKQGKPPLGVKPGKSPFNRG